ncbi:MAG TPA: hypothetical protein VFY66_16300 [Anaerolineales bacterium]|nr:hypothetical protein [Anaerolineales bacterium]
MNPQYILVAAVIVLMGWFAIGVVYNLRRGDALLKWMQSGLPGIGQKTTFRWLGTSVAELVIAHAKKPFRRLETLLVLKPRDVFWMTILAYMQGREDIVIFRGQLTTAPLTDLELVDPKSWSGRSVLKEFTDRKWESQNYRGLQLMAPAGLLDLARQTLDRLTLPMQKLSDHYVRFSLRRETSSAQNFEVHVPFPAYRTLDAKQYFEALRGLARAISERD